MDMIYTVQNLENANMMEAGTVIFQSAVQREVSSLPLALFQPEYLKLYIIFMQETVLKSMLQNMAKSE